MSERLVTLAMMRTLLVLEQTTDRTRERTNPDVFLAGYPPLLGTGTATKLPGSLWVAILGLTKDR